MRRSKMNHLFARLAEVGIGDEQRHGWAEGVLNRTVISYTSLTVDEIDALIANLDAKPDAYVMCGERCPDGWPCVVDVGHVDRGEDHAREDGIAWAVR